MVIDSVQVRDKHRLQPIYNVLTSPSDELRVLPEGWTVTVDEFSQIAVLLEPAAGQLFEVSGKS